MQEISRFRRVLITLTLGLFLFGSMAGTAAASSSEPQNSAACPQSGQRVKTSISDYVYLVDPEGFLRWVPGPAYTNLWDNWNIGVYDNLFTECFAAVSDLENARLVKSSLSSNVYIWDRSMPSGGAYRWIAGPEIFNKYGFSWAKIKTQSSVTPIASQWPWDN